MSHTPYPIGTISPVVLDGGTWLQMNGQVVSQSTYASLFKILGHQPQFTWSFSPVTGNQVAGFAYGASTYVAVAGSGLIFYASSPAGPWSTATGTGTTSFNSVAFGAGIFVAVNQGGGIYTSTNGSTWTSQTSGFGSTSIASVIYANSYFVAVGGSGYVGYSSNGTTWTTSQISSSASLGFVGYNSSLGIWIAGNTGSGSSGFCYSSNATSWSYVAKPTTNSCCFVGWDSSYFYCEDATTGTLYRSSNASSWTSFSTFVNYSVQTSLTSRWTSAGVIMLGGFNYTANGFTSVLSYNFIGTAPASNNITFIGNAQGTSRNFQLFYSAGSIFGSADGKTWYSQPSGTVFASFSPSAGGPSDYVNGYYIYYTNNACIVSAPDPYAPSTQFQIPNSSPNGTTLYIKAL